MILVFGQSLGAQITVYPGDANDNGIVNNIDVLYVGYSFGTTGPSRVFTDSEFEPQEAPAAWSNIFPDGTSYAHADANGDGLVGTQDLLAVYKNYGEAHPPVIPDDFPEPPEGAARLYMEEDSQPFPLTPGSEFSIPLYLNDPDHPLDVNGLAFSFEYDAEVIKEVRLEWLPGWFNSDSSWYGLQVPFPGSSSQLDIVATRFGNDPVRGGGILGRLHIIIEDDLIELLPAPTDSIKVLIGVKFIRGVGKDFDPIPLEGDEHYFTVYHPDARPNKLKNPKNNIFNVYPNPVRHQLNIEARKNIHSAVISDLLGRILLRETQIASTKFQLPVNDLPPGLYLLRVQTGEGIGTRVVLVE